jgi:prepilin peptidase dependent protein B
MLIINRKQVGFTLIEMLISISLGIIAVSSVMYFYMTNLTSSYSTLKRSKLNQEMSTLVSMMANDIRRAGFGNLSYTLPQNNAFSDEDAGTVLMVGDDQSIKLGTCIRFSYDYDLDSSIDTSEYYGYKLLNNEVQMRTGNVTCASSSNWESVTDKNEVKVTSLYFDLDGVGSNDPTGGYENSFDRKSECFNSTDTTNYDCYDNVPVSGSQNITLESRFVIISIKAELADDSSTNIVLERGVLVKNHHIKEW